MIIVKLIGGLGNQMFQYSLGRALSVKNKTGLKLDISGYGINKLHNYSLSHFNIAESFASKADIEKLLCDPKMLLNDPKILLEKLLAQKTQPFASSKRYTAEKKFIAEKCFQFDNKILQLKDNFYLDGYWQSEKYFRGIKNIIYKDFTVKNELSGKDLEIHQIIKEKDSISLHIRRGDYVNNQVTNKVNGTCSLDYYNQSAAYIAEKSKKPHFFIFSDDPAWVKDNLKLPYPMTFVNHNNAETNFEDMRLMSLCNHNIIANSSFSWWGAWLNKHKDKIVIAPARWLRDDSKNTRDVIPAGWIKK